MSDEIQIRFAARLKELRGLRERLRQGLVGLGVDEPNVDRLLLVMDEIASNAIEHGQHYRAGDQPLMARVVIVQQRIRVEFEDDDTPRETVAEVAEELAAWDHGVPPALLLERGRGMFLVNEFLTNVQVVETEQGGMLLTGWLAS